MHRGRRCYRLRDTNPVQGHKNSFPRCRLAHCPGAKCHVKGLSGSLARARTAPGRVSATPNLCLTPPNLICCLPRIDRNIGSRLSINKSVDACLGTDRYVTSLEHVQARLTLSYNRRGDLQINLISPAGTRSTLLHPRYKHTDVLYKPVITDSLRSCLSFFLQAA